MNSALLYLFREPLRAKLSRLLPYCVSHNAAYYPTHASDIGHLAYLDRTLIYFPVRLRSCIRAAARHTRAKRAEKGIYMPSQQKRLFALWCGMFLFFNSVVRHRILCWQNILSPSLESKNPFPLPYPTQKNLQFLPCGARRPHMCAASSFAVVAQHTKSISRLGNSTVVA